MQTHNCKKCYLFGIVLCFVIIVIACSLGFYRISIIDTHEHIESLTQAEMLMKANGENDITKTVLVPSPVETLTLNGHKSFTGYRQNTEELLKIAEAYPGKFIPFCTINPLESDALKYLQDCIERGGKGIKLYNGHSYYYDIFGIPLDSPRVTPIYAYAERNDLPLLYHINITKYGAELESVLQKYPDLVMSIPHYMVSSIGIDKVSDLLEKYPNLYTDLSFGSPEFMAAGFRRISKDPGKYGNFFNDYSDRILFGADMVLTSEQKKDVIFMSETLACYKALLEEKSFECGPIAGYYEKLMKDTESAYQQCKPKEGAYCESMREKMEAAKERHAETLKLNGLSLRPAVLERIYKENAIRFLSASH